MVSYDIFLYLQDDLLRILGEKHRLYDFLSNLSVKCSYLLFNKEHVKEILLEAVTHKSSGNTQYTQSCMDILVVDMSFLHLISYTDRFFKIHLIFGLL